MLSRVINDKWQGLEDGSPIKILRTCTKKTTGAESVDERFFISSIFPTVDAAQRLAEVVRMHWSIENRLHWLLDMRFNQDRMQANTTAYIANHSALNKLALAFLEQYNFWLWPCSVWPAAWRYWVKDTRQTLCHFFTEWIVRLGGKSVSSIMWCIIAPISQPKVACKDFLLCT